MSPIFWPSKNCTIVSIVHTLIPHLLPNSKHSSPLIIPPSLLSVLPSTSSPSFTSSHKAPAGRLSANRHSSMVASVCPLRSLKPPSLARSGKTCPRRRKDFGVLQGDASVRQVSARSWAEIPVVVEASAQSMEIVYAVPSTSVLCETICGSVSEVVRDEESGQQVRPLVCRTIKAILSVVTSSAAMMRSPSFSREGESRTMTKLPCSETIGNSTYA